MKLKAKLYFENLALKQKIYLYMIPILIVLVYFINIPNKSIYNNTKNKVQHKKSKNQLEIIEYFEKIVKTNKLILNSISFNNSTDIRVNGNVNSIVKFINITNVEYKILSYTISLKNKKIYLDIKYDKNKVVYIKQKKINKYDLKNPFIKERKTKKKLSLAIIGQNVLINDKWYKQGDMYKNKRIIKIYKNKIELRDKDKISIIKIFDEK